MFLKNFTNLVVEKENQPTDYMLKKARQIEEFSSMIQKQDHECRVLVIVSFVKNPCMF